MTCSELSEFKIAIVGDYAVGKSSLITRFIEDKFIENGMTPTINNSFSKISYDAITLNIWDTAGQEKFQSILGSYLKSVDGVIIVQDISINSENEILNDAYVQKWINKVTNVVYQQVPIVIAMNKTDLVSIDLKTILQNNREYIYTSAKTGSNVQVLFTTLTKYMISNKNPNKKKNIIKLSKNKRQHVGSCIC